MVEGKRVRIELDQTRKDRYGWTLAYVYLGDGTFLNAEIIKKGYGHAYTRFPFWYLEDFRRYEREAREAGQAKSAQRLRRTAKMCRTTISKRPELFAVDTTG